MCGITGIFSKNSNIDISKYYESHLLIKHRGPDDEGFLAINENDNIEFFKGNETIIDLNKLRHINELNNSNLILGHRRLSILDLTENGHQPMCYENLSITYNGEIFNYLEIKNDLLKLGYIFTSNSDTEVILKGFHCWGTNILNKLDGMFAFVIYNSKNNSLFLARDNFGIKPLYYSFNENYFMFSSEMKFLLNYNSNLKKINNKQLKLFLKHIRQDTSIETFFQNIYQIPAGTFMVIDKDLKLSSNTYYKLKLKKIKTKLPNDILEKELKEELNQAVNSRMLSDVKVGSLLSGGLDSNIIVSYLAESNRIDGYNFEAFSAVYKDYEKINEFNYIEDTRGKYNINVKYISPKIENIQLEIDKLLFHLEEPIRSLSVFVQYKLYEKIKNESDVRVVLNGQGSDEIFGGYHHHLLFALAENFGNFRFYEFYKGFKYLNFKLNVNHYKMLIKYCFTSFVKSNYFNFKLSQEITVSPLPEFLKYDDRTSMAFGIEARPPFLTKNLVDYSINLPLNSKIKNGQGKFILREISKGIVVESILNRKDKLGFSTPQKEWMDTYLKEDIIQSIEKFDFMKLGLKKEKKHKKIIKDYKNGNANWQTVWQYYILIRWYNLWIN